MENVMNNVENEVIETVESTDLYESELNVSEQGEESNGNGGHNALMMGIGAAAAAGAVAAGYGIYKGVKWVVGKVKAKIADEKAKKEDEKERQEVLKQIEELADPNGNYEDSEKDE